MKTEYAWVIQRDDGKYAWYDDIKRKWHYCRELKKGSFYTKKRIKTIFDLEKTYGCFGLPNCKPVKVELKVVENGEV